jgi:hypothetical protein
VLEVDLAREGPLNQLQGEGSLLPTFQQPADSKSQSNSYQPLLKINHI